MKSPQYTTRARLSKATEKKNNLQTEIARLRGALDRANAIIAESAGEAKRLQDKIDQLERKAAR